MQCSSSAHITSSLKKHMSVPVWPQPSSTCWSLTQRCDVGFLWDVWGFVKGRERKRHININPFGWWPLRPGAVSRLGGQGSKDQCAIFRNSRGTNIFLSGHPTGKIGVQGDWTEFCVLGLLCSAPYQGDSWKRPKQDSALVFFNIFNLK